MLPQVLQRGVGIADHIFHSCHHKSAQHDNPQNLEFLATSLPDFGLLATARVILGIGNCDTGYSGEQTSVYNAGSLRWSHTITSHASAAAEMPIALHVTL